MNEVPYSGWGPDPRFLSEDRKRGVLRSDRLVVPLQDVAANSPIFAAGTHSFTASYSTGGDAVNPALPSVPTRAAVLFTPRGGYTFEYVAGDKVKAFSSGGTEVAAATDLTSLNPVALLVVGTRPTDVYVTKFSEGCRLSSVELLAGCAVTANSTNYWKIRAQLVRAVNGNVDELGVLSTAVTSLAAGSRYDVFAAGGPGTLVQVLAGDVLRLRFEENGHAPALLSPVVTIKRRRL